LLQFCGQKFVRIQLSVSVDVQVVDGSRDCVSRGRFLGQPQLGTADEAVLVAVNGLGKGKE